MKGFRIEDIENHGCPYCGDKEITRTSYVPDVVKFFECQKCHEKFAALCSNYSEITVEEGEHNKEVIKSEKHPFAS